MPILVPPAQVALAPIRFRAETPKQRWFQVLLIAVLSHSAVAAGFEPLRCEGTYRLHLQGVCTSDDAVFWCFTDKLVKTDSAGTVQKQISVPGHHGDLCHHSGKVYVAVFLRPADRAEGEAESWIYVYKADDLSLLTRHPVVEAIHRAGGIAYHEGRYIVVGGSPKDVEENHVFEYDANFRFVKKHALKGGSTNLGIQTVAFADGHWWFGCYGKVLLKADEALQSVERFEFDCAVGIVPLSAGRFLIARGGAVQENAYTGRLVVAHADVNRGLVVEAASRK